MALQNVDGSWALSSGLASVLEIDEAEIKGKMPGEVRGEPLTVAVCHPGAVAGGNTGIPRAAREERRDQKPEATKEGVGSREGAGRMLSTAYWSESLFSYRSWSQASGPQCWL